MSSHEKNLNDCLDQQSYGIKYELQMKNKLQNNTSWRWDFEQAPKYDYDLRVYYWDDDPEAIGADREHVGYVELERAQKWIDGFPENWDRLCFLRRKVHEFHAPGRWGETKNDLPTIYLKTSRDLEQCFSAPISVIDEDGRETPRSDGRRDNSYLSLDYHNRGVRYGIEDCSNYIMEFFQ